MAYWQPSSIYHREIQGSNLPFHPGTEDMHQKSLGNVFMLSEKMLPASSQCLPIPFLLGGVPHSFRSCDCDLLSGGAGVYIGSLLNDPASAAQAGQWISEFVH
jgi:hypothetical protein